MKLPSLAATALLTGVVLLATEAQACALQISGMPSATFRQSIGVNLHLDHTDGEWANYPFIGAALRAEGFARVRSSLALNKKPAIAAFLQQIDDSDAADAIRSIQIVDTSFTSVAQIKSAVNIWGIDSFENANELDNGDANWLADLNRMIPLVSTASKNWGGISVIGPSLTTQDPKQLGNISGSVAYVNVHPYTADRMPETPGWGGDVYANGTIYGSLAYNVATAQRAASGKPAIATEDGFSTAPGRLSESTQASYLERAMLYNTSNGVPTFLYDLMDESGTGDGAWGLFRPDGSPKPSAYGVQGLMSILADGTKSTAPCTANITMSTTQPVDTMLVCHASGEQDLVLWRPVELQDPNTHNAETITPSMVSLAMTSPGVERLFLQNTSYNWFVNTSPTITNLSINERPTVVAFHAAGNIPGLIPMPSP
jgi:hypothetical protein